MSDKVEDQPGEPTRRSPEEIEAQYEQTTVAYNAMLKLVDKRAASRVAHLTISVIVLALGTGVLLPFPPVAGLLLGLVGLAIWVQYLLTRRRFQRLVDTRDRLTEEMQELDEQRHQLVCLPPAFSLVLPEFAEDDDLPVRTLITQNSDVPTGKVAAALRFVADALEANDKHEKAPLN